MSVRTIAQIAAVAFTVFALASCGSNEDVPVAQSVDTVNEDDPFGSLAAEYASLVQVDPGFDLSSGETSIEDLVAEYPTSGVGRLSAISTDLAIEYGEDDQEHLLVFEIMPSYPNGGELYLVAPGAPQIDSDAVNEYLAETDIQAFYIGQPLESSGSIVSSGRAVPDGEMIAVLHGFPLLVGSSDGLAVSLTESNIPATDQNLEPLRAFNLDVRGFGQASEIAP